MDTPDRPTGGGFDFSRLVPQRSFGLKLILVCALAFVMAVPAIFVWSLVYMRSTDATRAVEEVAQMRGGQQDLMGPAIVVPFERDVIVSQSGINSVRTDRGRMVLYAETGTADTRLVTEVRKRGLHDVPTYTATTKFGASFDPSRLLTDAPSGARFNWTQARIYLGMGDLRGAKQVDLRIAGRALDLTPVDASANSMGGANPLSNQPLVSAAIGWTTEPLSGPIAVTAEVAVTGAQRISVAPFARDTTITMAGDWGSPSFDGGILPDQRTVNRNDFTASWRIPFLARGTPGAGVDLSFETITAMAPGATLMDRGNPYQSVERALKYAPMFIGLVFLTYFLFEVTSSTRAHPAQYVLVGLAQSVFYMLLLSISEVAGFTIGFAIAATCTVLALSLYAGSVFASRWAAAKAFVVFAALYSLIYVLMRQEDYGLLVGSVASFLAITGTMWMTRNLDWYGTRRMAPPAPPQPETQA
jgi:inner membrane protein